MNRTQQWAMWLTDLHRWVRASLAVKELWQVRLPGDYWVCPYCMEIAALSSARRHQIEQIATHLADSCTGFEDIGVAPRNPRARLDYKALCFFTRTRLATSAAWQMRDAEGHWICPYCAYPSALRIEGKVTRRTLISIVDIIAHCAAFEERGYPGYLTVEQIQKEMLRWAELQEYDRGFSGWMGPA